MQQSGKAMTAGKTQKTDNKIYNNNKLGVTIPDEYFFEPCFTILPVYHYICKTYVNKR